MPNSDYIVFVDESGDHSLTRIDEKYPMFVLAFCVMAFDDYNLKVAPALRRLKYDLFGHDTVVLHEVDIVRRRGAFSGISEEQRNAFMGELSKVIAEAPMTIIAIAIDKKKHAKRYAHPSHPYHLAMQFGLERLHSHMHHLGRHEHMTSVVFECRGEKEDKELELQFRRMCAGQTAAGRPLSLDIVMADKKCNSEGLQVADLVARPIGRHVLYPDQPNKAYDVIEKKLAVNKWGSPAGWGLKVFP